MSIGRSERSIWGNSKVAAPHPIAAHIASYAVNFSERLAKTLNLPPSRQAGFRFKTFKVEKEEENRSSKLHSREKS